MVSPETAASSGKTGTLHGPFTPGPLSLVVSWTDGTTRLTYTVTTSDCCAAHDTDRTIKYSDTNVDPETVSSDGNTEITFSEEVTGHIILQTDAGEDVGWIGKVEGYRGILELVKGKELKRKQPT